MASFDALLSPGQFKARDKEPEQLLMDFDLYVKGMKNFFVAVGKENANDRTKLAVLQAVGGPDMLDLVELTGRVQLEEIPEVVAVQPANGMPGVLAVPGVPADTYDQALVKIRQGIVKQTNQAMSRFKLFQQMPQEDRKFDPWAKDVLKQAERCDWERYNSKAAATDAILFQTADSKLRKKILAENMDFDHTLAWGQTHESSGRKADQMESATGSQSKDMRRLEEKLRRLQSSMSGGDSIKCQTCPRKHQAGYTCPGLSQTCFKCRSEGHFQGAPICKGKSEQSKSDSKIKDYKKKKTKKVRKLQLEETEEDTESEDSSDGERLGRIAEKVRASKDDSSETDMVTVSARPRHGGIRLEIQWTPDSGVNRSLLAERDWVKLKEKNPSIQLTHFSKVKFRPYGTTNSLPIMGTVRVVLKCQAGETKRTTLHVIKGQEESLLGKRDCEAMGIIVINKEGCEKIEKVMHITRVKRTPVTGEGIVSGGQSQPVIEKNMENITNKFPELFTGIGVAKVPPVHIRLKDNVHPVTQTQRVVPLNMLRPLQDKLDRFVREGVIDGPLGPEHATGWVHNVVLSGKRWDPNQIRLNLDTRPMNAAVIKNQYPIPTPEQLRHNFRGSDRFSIIDMNDSFHQFTLDEESKDLFKFTTPAGIYRYNRLVMGTPPASAECHGKMTDILRGLEGCLQIKDDVVIHGKGTQHDERLQKVLERFREYGLTLNKKKCQFGRESVVWFGHVFSKDGMSPDPEKVAHIKKWPEPEDKAAVKSFLQTVQFVSSYMHVGDGETYSGITAPLRKLTRQGTHFNWTEECRTSFKRLQDLLAEDIVLVHYDPERETRLYVDHGPEGVASTVAQGYDIPEEHEKQWRAVHHKSRSLQPAEKNYQKIEGESLAVYSGILVNKMYLYGTKFTVVSDHQPLIPLYNSPNRPAPLRVERHRSKLRQFDFKLIFEPGSTSPCDYGSRHPPPSKTYSKEEKEEWGIEEEDEDGEIWVNRVIQDVVPEAVTLAEVREATQQDPLLSKLMADIQRGRLSEELRNTEYKGVFEELTTTSGVILKGERLVMPKALHPMVIALAHEGHQGEDRTTRNLREKVWFPKLAEKCREFVKTCHPGCTSSVPIMTPAPITSRETPDGPWKVCQADYKGPIGGQGGYYFHVLVDVYSKWPEVCVTKSTAFDKLFPHLDTSFAMHGIPEKIIHDGGPPYNGRNWKMYARESGFKTELCTPEHPQSNGLAEKMMSSIAKITHAALAERKDPKLEITKFLINYRNTPHSATGKSPSELMMKRKIRTKIPSWIPAPTSQVHMEAQKKDRQAKRKQKEYADKRRRAKHQDVREGDLALIKQKKSTTKQPWDPRPYRVSQVKKTRITGERDGKIRTRNIEKWKILKERPEDLKLKKKESLLRPVDSDSEWDFDLKEGENRGGGNLEGNPPREQERDAPIEPEQEAEIQQRAYTSPVAARTRARKAAPPSTPQHGGPQPGTSQLSPQERRRRQAAAAKEKKKESARNRGSYNWTKTGGGRFIKQWEWVPGGDETD